MSHACHLCCPNCLVRFPTSASAYLTACPECGAPPVPVDALQDLVGYRLMDPLGIPDALAELLAVPLAIPPRDDLRRPEY